MLRKSHRTIENTLMVVDFLKALWNDMSIQSRRIGTLWPYSLHNARPITHTSLTIKIQWRSTRFFLSLQTLIPMLAKWSRVMTTVPNSSMGRAWSGCHSPELPQVPELDKNLKKSLKKTTSFQHFGLFFFDSRPWSQCWPSDPKAWQRCQIRPLVGPDQAATPQSFHRYLILPRISKRV